MHVSEWAEQILFSEKIADKLFWPEHLDVSPRRRPSPPQPAPRVPARPRELRWTDATPSKRPPTPFPALEQLESLPARGQALHFFANHELLALELMALALWRFDQVPPRFQRGLACTLRDEQKHMRLYLHKMNEFGIEFGSVPVNGFFWKCLAPLSDPRPFIAGLSLTFEQANLDFSRFYQQAFQRIGDLDTAAILHTVYQDEIRHVRHGLQWFQRWRPQHQSLWQAYCADLAFPLTPQRAKGEFFDLSARQRAGLDADYVQKLEVFSHSKGRAPIVYCFWPDCEEGWRHFPKPTTRKKWQSDLADDLATLPLFHARPSDIVLVPQRPTPEWCKALLEAGFTLPEFITWDESHSSTGFKHRTLSHTSPWGRCPASDRALQNLQGQCAQHDSRALKDLPWQFSKIWAQKLLRDFLSTRDQNFLCPLKDLGTVVQEPLQVITQLQRIFAAGHSRAVIKSPVGASGRHFLIKDHTPLRTAETNWLKKQLRLIGEVIVEPWLNKEFEYSVQIHVHRGGQVKIHGTARFLTDEHGQYLGAWLGGLTTGLSTEHKAFLNHCGQEPHRLRHHFKELSEFVAARAHHHGYHGPIGIDAFAYRDHASQLRLKPLVETNLRWNMGRTVVEIEKSLGQRGTGLWKILTSHDLKKLGCANFAQLNHKLGEFWNPLRAHAHTGFVQATWPLHHHACAYIFRDLDHETLIDKLNALGLSSGLSFDRQHERPKRVNPSTL